MKKLFLCDMGEVRDVTLSARFNDPIATNRVATQHWRWHGGDAVIVPTTALLSRVFLRQGEKVYTVEAKGLKSAMHSVGLDPNSFEVQ
jgi:hypothetical protein